ncbi:MAG: S-layer homology domain-containing protein [Clostridia bacterium]|nr:S-layer homology domain-containing protein [Clostridia bacterium]
MKNAMKKCLSMLLMLCMVVPMMLTGTASFAQEAATPSSAVATADFAVNHNGEFREVGNYPTKYNANNPPAIDGVYDEWDEYSLVIAPDNVANWIGETELGFGISIAVVKTADNFYLYGKFEDPNPIATTETNIANAKGGIFNGDSVRFGFDLNGVFAAKYPDSDYAAGYTISFAEDAEGVKLLNVYHDVANRIGSINEKVAYSVDFDDAGWKFELAIPTTLIIEDFNDALFEHGNFADRIPGYSLPTSMNILFSYIDKDAVSFEPVAGYSTVSAAAAADESSTGLNLDEAGIYYSSLNCSGEHVKSDYFVVPSNSMLSGGLKFNNNKTLNVKPLCKYCNYQFSNTKVSPTFKEITVNAEFYEPTIDGDFAEWENRYVEITDDSIADNENVFKSVLTFPIKLAMAHTKKEGTDSSENVIFSGYFDDRNLKCSTAEEEPNFYPFDEAGEIDSEKIAASDVWSGDSVVFYIDMEAKAHKNLVTPGPLFYSVTPVETEDGITLRVFRGGAGESEVNGKNRKPYYGEITDKCTFAAVKTEAGGWKFELLIPFKDLMKDDIYNMQKYNALATPSPYSNLLGKDASYMMLTYYDKNAKGELFAQYSTIRKSTGSPSMTGKFTHEAGMKLIFADCLSHESDGKRVKIRSANCAQHGATAEHCILCHAAINIEEDTEELPPHTPGDWTYNECNAEGKKSMATGYGVYYGAYWERSCLVCLNNLDSIYQRPTWKQVGKIHARKTTPTIDGNYDEWTNRKRIVSANTKDMQYANIPYQEMDDTYLQFKYDDENLYMYAKYLFATNETTRYEDPREQIEMQRFNPCNTFEYKKGTQKSEYTTKVWDGDSVVYWFDMNDFSFTNYSTVKGVEPGSGRYDRKGTAKAPRYAFSASENEEGGLDLRIFRVSQRYDLYSGYHEVTNPDTKYSEKAKDYFQPSEEITAQCIGKASYVAPDDYALTGGWEYEVAIPWDLLLKDFNYSAMNVGGWIDALDENQPVTLENLTKFSVLQNRYDVTYTTGEDWGRWATISERFVSDDGHPIAGNGTGVAEAGIFVDFVECDHSNIDNWTVESEATYSSDGVEVNTCPKCGDVIDSRVTPRLELPFNDVESEAWYEKAVRYAYDKGVMIGVDDGEFGTKTPMTREMFVTMLAAMSGFDKEAYANKTSFADVEIGKWYSEAVEWAFQNKITSGTGDNVFGVGQPITRAQFAMFMQTYARYLKYDLSRSPRADLADYEDTDEIPTWAEDAIKWAVSARLIEGTSETTLSPNMVVTRDQVAQIVMKFMERYPVKYGPDGEPMFGIPTPTAN